MYTACVVTMALAQPGTMPPTRQPTTLMRPTGTVERPTQRPPPDDGTRRDDCDATQEEINNCPCNIMRDDTGCPECPDSCSGELCRVEQIQLYNTGNVTLPGLTLNRTHLAFS